MTEDSSSEKLSSWNFDDLHNEDESNSSNDFFSVLKKIFIKMFILMKKLLRILPMNIQQQFVLIIVI